MARSADEANPLRSTRRSSTRRDGKRVYASAYEWPNPAPDEVRTPFKRFTPAVDVPYLNLIAEAKEARRSALLAATCVRRRADRILLDAARCLLNAVREIGR
jgi:hypothetical protein